MGNVIKLDDYRKHKVVQCYCSKCERKFVTVVEEGAVWPRECSYCFTITLEKEGEQPCT